MKRFASKAALAAAMAAACGAGLLTGPVARAQVITAAGNTPVLAATDFNNDSLDFYQRNDATMLWGKPEQVAGPGTTTSVPAVAQLFPALAQLGNATGIAVQGGNDSLDFYLQRAGGAAWGGSQVGGPGTTFGPPALAEAGHDVVIAAQGPGDVIDFYSEPYGYYSLAGRGPTWSEQQVSGFDSGSPPGPYGPPSITQAGDYTVITAIGPNDKSVYMFWQQDGTTMWYSDQVAGSDPYSTFAGASVVQVGSSIVIAVGSNLVFDMETAPSVDTYTLPIGLLSSPTIGASSWGTLGDLGGVQGNTGEAGPLVVQSIAQVGNSVVVLVDNIVYENTGQTTAMNTYWHPIAPTSEDWTLDQVGTGGYLGESIAQLGQSVVIGAGQHDGTGLFWWKSVTDTGTWNPETVN